jgi:hypothetical protein
VTILLIDGLIALVKITDRGMTAVEQSVRRRFPPRTVDDAQPAGAGTPPSAAGTGGHPVRDTSELLSISAGFVRSYMFSVSANGSSSEAFVRELEGFVAELRDRAAQLRAVGD